jgi:lysylphosphatidylglycerol synthetase-like protein (DUF2156 family)
MLKVLLIGVVAGAASALYLAYNYQPILVQGAIHAAIFASGLVVLYFAKKKLDAKVIGWYLAGALPVHLAIHFMVIGDLAQLMGVSHILLNFLSLP